jgi:hypothetical protein
MSGRRLLCVGLSATCLLAGCGASSKRSQAPNVGKHVVVQPIKGSHLLGGIVLRDAGQTKRETPAEELKVIERFAAWTREHCPCDFEQTATGPHLVSERHP